MTPSAMIIEGYASLMARGAMDVQRIINKASITTEVPVVNEMNGVVITLKYNGVELARCDKIYTELNQEKEKDKKKPKAKGVKDLRTTLQSKLTKNIKTYGEKFFWPKLAFENAVQIEAKGKGEYDEADLPPKQTEVVPNNLDKIAENIALENDADEEVPQDKVPPNQTKGVPNNLDKIAENIALENDADEEVPQDKVPPNQTKGVPNNLDK
eukprot:Platyproteum_vivax@DN7961_c0_g1_i1.p1